MLAKSSGSQLELPLSDTRVCLPWAGISPRELTRAWKTFSLKAHPAGGPHANAISGVDAHFKEGCSDPEQLLLFIRRF